MEPFIDFAEGVRLCGGNSALYSRMLSRFLSDPTANLLEDAWLRGDAKEVFLQAHTLKGLAAQLALPALYSAACPLLDALRAHQAGGPNDAAPLMGKLSSVYRDTLCALSLFTAQ